MFREICKPLFQCLHIHLVQFALRHASVHLQSAHRCHDDHRIGMNARKAAFDVQKLLRAQIRAEACLRHHIIREFQRKFRRHDAVAAMRDIREGPAMDKGRRSLQGLYQIRLDGILKEQSERPGHIQFLGAHHASVTRIGHHDLPQAALHILQTVRKAEDRHHLRGHGDIKARLARHAVRSATEPDHYVAECAVIEIQHTFPHHAAHIDVQRIALLDMVVNDRRQQVMRRRNRMKIPGEMQVDVLHRNNLRIAAACRAALQAKAWPQGRLPQGDHHFLPLMMERIRKPHAVRGLALSRRCRVDGRHEHQFPVGTSLQFLPHRKGQLCLVLSVKLQLILRDAKLLRYFFDRTNICLLRNFHIRLHIPYAPLLHTFSENAYHALIIA